MLKRNMVLFGLLVVGAFLMLAQLGTPPKPIDSLLAVGASPALAQGDTTPEAPNVKTGYVDVNGLHMYYEMHGSGGTPLIILHGAYMNFSLMGEIVLRLAETRQVIGVDLQAHGRTNDVEGRPLTFEQMA